jgi:hypothetical protein
VDTSSKACQTNEFWKLSYAMQVLGLDGRPKASGGDNECFRIEHWDPQKYENKNKVPAINQWYKVADTYYRVSMGGVCREGGVLTIKNSLRKHISSSR